MNAVASSVIVVCDACTRSSVYRKRNVAVVHVEQPLVGDRDAVGVPADVVEHLLGAREGRLCVDHPLGVPRRL